MLFNSYEFIFIFLPITLCCFFFIGKLNNKHLAMVWLVLCSLFFYGWWNPTYLVLIIISMVLNFIIGRRLSKGRETKFRKYLMWFGVFINLFFLGYFKYTNFLIDQISLITNFNLQIDHIVLPLAISFFTFQQIAFLVDSYRKETKEFDFLQYCLFVTFFPQLIAGPIVHHKEMMPQFSNRKILRLDHEAIAIGLIIFTIGLFKKVIFADGIANYATPVFAEADAGVMLSFFTSWGGISHG